ncbi:MAG: hypothetical protein Q9207_005156 [Kuettlingeria erythrocarpa]
MASRRSTRSASPRLEREDVRRRSPLAAAVEEGDDGAGTVPKQGAASAAPMTAGERGLAVAQQPTRYRTYPMAAMPDLQEDVRHSGQCRQLAAALIQAWNAAAAAGAVGPLADMIRNWRRSVSAANRPSQEQSREAGSAFFHLTYWSLDAPGALAWLLTANWDLERAVQAYMSHRFSLDGAPESERDENGLPEEEEGEEEPYVDEDPDNIGDIPDDLELEQFERGDRCVRHENIRGYLIDQAATQGAYVYGRKQHPENDENTIDKTSFLESQRLWGFEERSQYPPILFVFHRRDRRDPAYPGGIPNMRWRGLLVIDHDGLPIRRFRNIPAALSTQMEGGLMEAIRREDSQVTMEDFMARMLPAWDRQKAYPTNAGDINAPTVVDKNTIAARAGRFRARAGCINWYGRPTVPSRCERYLMSVIPQVLEAANSTAGMDRDFSRNEVERMNVKPEQRPPNVSITLAPEFPAGSDGKAKSRYHPDKEHDCRDCMPVGPDDIAALNDALLITVAHFMDLTKMCPRVPLGRNTYRQFLRAIKLQLWQEFAIIRRRRTPSLRSLGRWTGGISRWRSAAIVN